MKTYDLSGGNILALFMNSVYLIYRHRDDYVDTNPAFHLYTDIDYEIESGGVKKSSFVASYLSWIQYAYEANAVVKGNKNNPEITEDSELVTLCFALSQMGRKALASAAHQTGSGATDPVRIELFLHGLHSLFQVSSI